ncbi:MAG: SPOR domain-containing protein [Saprospiraceae bacterium]|nr:SPOR domain-containing protein [Saprospiraceae bacterium]
MLSSVMAIGQVTVKEEPIVAQAMDTYMTRNLEENIIRGWRIQIITTDDRREMDLANQKFSMLYPHIKYEWQHNAPYYQVRIGAYEKKEDLEAFLLELKKEFPSAIPVQDDIKKEDLIESNG